MLETIIIANTQTKINAKNRTTYVLTKTTHFHQYLDQFLIDWFQTFMMCS